MGTATIEINKEELLELLLSIDPLQIRELQNE